MRKRKHVTKLFSVLLSFAVIFTLIPGTVYAGSESQELIAYLHISIDGELARVDKEGVDKDKFMAWRPVTVSDKTADDKITVEDMLICAHEQYRQGGVADLDISNNKVWGSDLVKLNLYYGSEVKKADKDTVIEAEEHITISGSTVAGREYRYCNFEHAGESISFSKDGIEDEDIYFSMLVGSAESEDEFSLSTLTAEYDVIIAEYEGKTLNTAESGNCEIAEEYIDFKLKLSEGKYIVSLRKKGGNLYFGAPAVILNIQSNSVQANFRIMGYDPDKAEGIQTLKEEKLDVWYEGKLAVPRGYNSMGNTVEAALAAAGMSAEFSDDRAMLNGVTWDRETQDAADDISLKNSEKTPRAMWVVIYKGQLQETFANKYIENNEDDSWIIYYTDDLAKELEFQFDTITAQAESMKKEGEFTCITPEFTPERKEYTVLYPEKSDRLTLVTVSENNENNIFRQIFFRDKKGEYSIKGRLLPANTVDNLRSISQYITANGYTDFKLVTCLRNLVGITFDEYRFDAKKLPLLNALTVEGNPIKQFDSLNRLSEFYISNQAKNIDIKPEAVRRDHIVTINGKAADNGEVFKLDLSKLTFEDDKADISITVKNNDTSVYGGETEYIVTLKREPATNEPTIMSQSLRSEGYALFEKPFKLKVHASASGKVSYQWYKGLSEDKSEALPIIGETGEELSPDTGELGELYYFCRITNEDSAENNAIDTETAKIEIYPDPTPKNTKWDMEIPELPEENAELFGEHEYGYYYKQRDANTETLSVSAEWPVEEGVTKAYLWTKISNTSTGVIGGANSSYKINASTANLGEIYRCIPIARYRGKAYKGEPVEVYVYIEEQVADLSAVGNALWKGEGTAEEPWEITSQEDLNRLRTSIDKKNYFSGHYFQLQNDIILTDNWVPIGYADTKTNGRNCKPFSGTFDGAGHTISFAEGSLPLFSFVREATVKNLNIYAPYMAGYALVENYVVDYGEDGRYNLGTSGSYTPGTPDTITAINVTLKSGSVIQKGGFMGGYASGGNTCVFSSCKVEDNVKIGWNKPKNKPEGTLSSGSFGSEISGKIINCESAATVYGEDYVGGIVGTKGQSMGFFEIKNCRFTGEVIATGEYAGGIVGAGYYHESAPNTPCSTIENCYSNAKITASDYIGGILGGERACTQAWNLCYVRNNLFNGEIVATTPNAIKGGIIGHYNSLNKYNAISNNYCLDSAAENGIGFIKIVDTNANIKDKNNAVYCNTSERLPGIVGVDMRDYNRSDDPLGEDADKLAKTVTTKELAGNDIIKKLNDGEGSLKNWTRTDGRIWHGTEPVACELTVKGRYKKTYVIGEPIDISRGIFVVSWSDGSETRPDNSEIEIKGFNNNVRGVQTVEFGYRGAKTEVKLTVLKPEQPDKPNTIKVYFTLLGDEIHEVTDENKHTLREGNLITWIPETEVEVNLNATVKTVFEKILGENRYSWQNNSGNYVSHITTPKGVTLGEFTNGKLSGWMYTLNGTHPMLGLAEQFLENGDKIVWHYTDDYTKEEGSEKWNNEAAISTDVTTAKDGNNEITTVKAEVNVSGDTATVTVKDENAAEMVKQAKEMKSSEIVLNADKAEANADKVKVELPKKVAENILADTKADLTVKLPEAEVKLSQAALKEITSQAKGDKLIIEVEKVKNPTDEQKKLAGKSAEVFALTVKSGDTVIHSFGAGKVTVRKLIPDRLKEKRVAAIYIPEAQLPENDPFEVMNGKRVTVDKKNFYEFTTTHFSDFALVDADEAGIEISESMTADEVKAIVKNLKLKATTKALKKSIRVTAKVDKETLMNLKNSGYELKYKYYRAVKKNGKYKLIATKKADKFTNAKVTKGKTYYYKVRLAVYDSEGKLIATTSLKNCKASKRQLNKAA